MSRTLSMLFLMAVPFTAPNARAGQYLNKCQSSAKSSVGKCKAASAQAAANDNARSAQTGASAGTNMNKNSGALGRDIAAQRANLGQAKSACEQAKQECSKQCDQAKQEAQAAAAKGDKQAQADAGQIPGTKKSECEAPIDGETGKLSQADSNLGKDGQDAGKTNDSSGSGGGGGMPPITPPQKDDKKKDDEKQTAQQGQGLQCGTNGTERFSDCNDNFVAKCKANMSSEGCNDFSNRYCNLSSSAPVSSTVGSRPTTNLVIDKRGEGMGSEYCESVNAYRYCQTSGRGACPSCVKLNGGGSVGSEAMNRARESCPTDPLFLKVGVDKGTSGTPVTTTGGGASPPPTGGKDRISGGTTGLGGGPSGGGGGIGAVTPESARTGAGNGAATEGSPRGTTVNMGTDGGGGGGGGSSGDGGELPPFEMPGDAPSEADLMKALGGGPLDRMPTADSGMPQDVARSIGPSLFSIGSTAYHNFCVRSNLRACK